MNNITTEDKNKIFKSHESYIPTIEEILNNIDTTNKIDKYNYMVCIPHNFKTNLNDQSIIDVVKKIDRLYEIEGHRCSKMNESNCLFNTEYSIDSENLNFQNNWNWYLDLAICIVNGFVVSSFKNTGNTVICNLNATDYKKEKWLR